MLITESARNWGGSAPLTFHHWWEANDSVASKFGCFNAECLEAAAEKSAAGTAQNTPFFSGSQEKLKKMAQFLALATHRFFLFFDPLSL